MRVTFEFVILIYFSPMTPYKFLILIFVIVASALTSFSQSNYLVLSNGDTLIGESTLIDNLNANVMKVQIKTADGKQFFNALEILEYHQDGKLYKPIKVYDIITIGELKSEGYLSLYYYKNKGEYQFSQGFLQKLNGESIILPNIGFKKIMADFLGDCPDISAQILERTLTSKHLDEIIDSYNECMNLITQTKINSPSIQVDEELNDLVNDIKATINSSEAENKSDFNELITDIQTRIQEKKDIPSYMMSAVRDMARENEDLLKKIEVLLNYPSNK